MLLASVAAAQSTPFFIKGSLQFPASITGDQIGVDGRLIGGMGGFDPDVVAAAAGQLVGPRFGGPAALEAAGRPLAVDRSADVAVALAGRGFDLDNERHSEATGLSDLYIRIL